MSDENNRFFMILDTIVVSKFPATLKSQYPLKFVDHGSHTGTGSDNNIVRTGIDMLLDKIVRMAVAAGHPDSGFVRFSMSISHKRAKTVSHGLFNRSIQSAARNPVAIKDFFYAIGSQEGCIITDSVLPELLKVFFQMVHLKHLIQPEFFYLAIFRAAKLMTFVECPTFALFYFRTFAPLHLCTFPL